jgi:hypothetical protein
MIDQVEDQIEEKVVAIEETIEEVEKEEEIEDLQVAVVIAEENNKLFESIINCKNVTA